MGGRQSRTCVPDSPDRWPGSKWWYQWSSGPSLPPDVPVLQPWRRSYSDQYGTGWGPAPGPGSMKNRDVIVLWCFHCRNFEKMDFYFKEKKKPSLVTHTMYSESQRAAPGKQLLSLVACSRVHDMWVTEAGNQTNNLVIIEATILLRHGLTHSKDSCMCNICSCTCALW